MARGQPLQSSFAYGEMSPRLLGRSDTDRYRQSLQICENAITLSHGNAVKRPGTAYLETSPTEGNIRLFALQADPATPLVVELGYTDSTGGYIRVLDREGYDNFGTQYVDNPSFLDGLTGWLDRSDDGASAAWVPPQYAQLIPAGGPDKIEIPYSYNAGNGNAERGIIQHQNTGGSVEMRISLVDADGVNRANDLRRVEPGDTIVAGGQTWTVVTWTLQALNIQFVAEVTPGIQIGNGLYTFSFNVVDPLATARIQQQLSITDTSVNYAFFVKAYSTEPGDFATLNVGSAAGLSDYATFAISEGDNVFVYDPPPGSENFWISIEQAPYVTGEGETFIDVVTLQADNAVIFEAATPWINLDLDAMQAAVSTQDVAIYFVDGRNPPQRLVNISRGAYVFEAVPFTTPPSSWVGSNQPRAVTFHQQRLWYAGTPTDPDTLWASQSNDFLNFNLGTGLPTEAIEFEMSDRGIIRWIQGSRDLLVGGDVAEYVVSADAGVIIPGDISAQQQSAYGSAPVQPVEVGNGVLYLGADRRRIRFMSYQFLQEGWVSVDLTWPSEHVTEPLVEEMSFLYAPDPLIWCKLADGTLISAVYEREQDNLVGWHRHPLPGADIKSIAMTKYGSGAELWIAAERVIAGQTVTYIERTVSGTTVLGSRFQPFADSSVLSTVEDDGEGNLIIQGLDHLEQQTVYPVINGAVHVPRIVSGGRVAVQKGFANINDFAVTGLQYVGKLRTLPLEGLNKTGTALATKMRRNRIFVRVLNSAIPQVNGVVSPARFPMTPMNDPQEAFTGDVQVADLGWDRFAQVEIDMPIAKSYTILSIFGDAESNTL